MKFLFDCKLKRAVVLMSAACLISFANILLAEDQSSCVDVRQFTFSWQFTENCNMQPRGGTTTGSAVVLDNQPHTGWLSIQEDGISDFEKDRRAILSMSGEYRTSFDFLEIAGYGLDYEPAKPYQSWATEKVYVIEDRGDFISLQHIIVMFFQEGEEVSGPMVMKHWRQDWQYEKDSLLSYSGNQTWEHQEIPNHQIPGSWSQAVYQVDDSPRYESWGEWEHNSNFSSWESAITWRPLPRRESSIRDDYQLLEGINRHTILRNGWLHEETNFKLRLDKDGKPAAQAYVAKELGVNRYELIVDHDFSGGDDYLEKTGAFWADVRTQWNAIIDQKTAVRLGEGSESIPMFFKLFEAAETVSEAAYDSENRSRQIREIINDYLR